MLPDDGVIDGALANEKLAAELGSPVYERGSGKAFRVGGRIVHVAFSVHDFVPLPVDDGTAGNAHFEDVRIVCHEGDGHEAAVAPAVYAYARRINVGKLQEAVYAHHLVLHLLYAALAVDGLLEGGAAVGCAAVVLYIHEVSLLRHEHFPHADLSQPGIANQLAVGAAVYVDHKGILSGSVEVLGIDEAVVIVKGAVGRGDGSKLYLAGGVVLQRV